MQFDQDGGSATTFRITTPTFNGGAYLDDTIATIVTQAGDFDLHYHVQDGGSRDGSVEKLARWQALFDHGALPISCRSVRFSFASDRDGGMYDAINRGFARLGVAPGDYIGWLNSSDRLAPGALATVAALFAKFPGYRFLGGSPAFVDESGVITGIAKPVAASRRLLRAGLHNGHDANFLMQEGSFWHGSVWLAAGGVAGGMRLAGDFDLWRRFGAETDFLAVEGVIGFHRRHSDQLSAAADAYWAEIKSVLDTALAETYPAERAAYIEALASASDYRASGFAGRFASFDYETQDWVLKTDYEPLKLRPLKPRIVVSDYISTEERSVDFAKGFREIEGPYPEYHIEGEVRWAIEPEVELVFEATAPGPHRLRIQGRNFWEEMQVAVTANGQRINAFEVPMTRHERDCVIDTWFDAVEGANRLTLAFEVPLAPAAAVGEYMMISAVRVIAWPRAPRKAWLRRRGMDDTAREAREERIRLRLEQLDPADRDAILGRSIPGRSIPAAAGGAA